MSNKLKMKPKLRRTCRKCGKRRKAMNCNDTKTFFYELERMCKSKKDCIGCPLRGTAHVSSCSASKSVKTLEAVQKWSDEHPPKTYKDDFLEKFPNAPWNNNEDRPLVCRADIYGRGNCPNGGCIECWNKLMEETE